MQIKTFVDGLPAIFPCAGLDEVFGWQMMNPGSTMIEQNWLRDCPSYIG